jgi:hypothetical protein
MTLRNCLLDFHLISTLTVIIFLATGTLHLDILIVLLALETIRLLEFGEGLDLRDEAGVGEILDEVLVIFVSFSQLWRKRRINVPPS